MVSTRKLTRPDLQIPWKTPRNIARIEADVACHRGGLLKTNPASCPVGETHTCLNNVWKRLPLRRPPPQNRRSTWPSIRSSSAATPILPRSYVRPPPKPHPPPPRSSPCSIPPPFPPP